MVGDDGPDIDRHGDLHNMGITDALTRSVHEALRETCGGAHAHPLSLGGGDLGDAGVAAAPSRKVGGNIVFKIVTGVQPVDADGRQPAVRGSSCCPTDGHNRG
jgi:hypothetical protein